MQVGRVLQSYVDGEADEVTARRVAVHLEECRRCGLELAAYREIKSTLARREAPDPDAVRRLHDFGRSLLGDGDDGDSAPEAGAAPPARL